MMRVWMAILLALAVESVSARVDTLFGTVAIEDAYICGSADCTPEVGGEDCRRYNTGGMPRIDVGVSELDDARGVMRFPGWDGTVPDSSVLELYCTDEADTGQRRIFVRPLTRRFFEGTEAGPPTGGYPDVDSGVTWLHVWLDIGDGDSLNWTAPGGDYDAGTVCTLLVAGTETWYRVRTFNRIISWWRDHDADPGIVLVNQNAFVANFARKAFASTEAGEIGPRLILYYSQAPGAYSRRLRVQSLERR